MEFTENWFEDFGSGKQDGGVATITLDPLRPDRQHRNRISRVPHPGFFEIVENSRWLFSTKLAEDRGNRDLASTKNSCSDSSHNAVYGP